MVFTPTCINTSKCLHLTTKKKKTEALDDSPLTQPQKLKKQNIQNRFHLWCLGTDAYGFSYRCISMPNPNAIFLFFNVGGVL